jgi:hypothetical protein
MPSRRYALTTENEAKILRSIRGGAFPHVAAEAAGIPRTYFEKYLEQGSVARARAQLRQFADEVRQAIALARLKGEMTVLHKKEECWLRYSPGKGSAEVPGWTQAPKAIPTHDVRKINLLASEDMKFLLPLLKKVLAPFPDALAQFTNALDRTPKESV